MSVIQSLVDEYRRYKALAEAAIAQVGDEELGHAGHDGGNSIEMLIRHIAGNLNLGGHPKPAINRHLKTGN